jgi:hypothetical protein
MQDSKASRGIGAFFYGAIPAVLGVAGLIWLSFLMGVVEFHHNQVQEGRRDNRVGAYATIRKPVDLVFNGKGCIHVERGYLDGDTATFYIHNVCYHEIDDISWSIREISPDGTTVESKRTFLSGSDDMVADEKREVQVDISSDQRVVKVAFSIDDFNDMSDLR